ncbi:MAG TPA: arylsulfatase [Planctomycetaceae bacterium]|nr:arylsulfatase [Planctomycetaceae bacterium]
MGNWRVVATLVVLIATINGGNQNAAAKELPNFLVIIADDMGFSDAGCYGGEISTPNLDALATGGLRFTQFYNTARCWPTRSALVTGYYPQQIRRDGMPGAPKNFGGRGKRPVWAKTIAEYLKPAGYRTYHSGKWHIDGQPTNCGFDLSDETSRGHGFFETIKRKNRDPNYYQTIHTAQHAVECLKLHAEQTPGQPFFQYVAFRAPHFPLHALPKDIAKYSGRYTDGWDTLRKQRHQRQKSLGIEVASLSPLEPDVGPPYAFPQQIEELGPGEINRPLAWDTLNEQQRNFQAAKMEIHAAMIDRMDQEIGRILDQLKTMDAFEKTLILFLSDNGASAEIMVRGDGHDPNAPMGSAETYLCLGPGFSSAANTPFRRHKTWVHEGGISTPLIAHWPKGITSQGEFRHAVGHVVDITPTLLDLAGVKRQESAAPGFAGQSLVHIFDNADAVHHEELWFCHEGNRALRLGDWKIIHSDKSRVFPYSRAPKPRDEESLWRLYNLASDRAEQVDLSAQEPGRLASMAERWTQLRDKFLSDSTIELPVRTP